MKNVLLALTAASAVAIATPALAGDLSGEVRFGGVAKNQVNTTEYRVQYDDALYNGLVNYGLELQTVQPEKQGAVSTLLSGKLGTALPGVLGLSSAAYAEVGQSLNKKVTTTVAGRTTTTGGNFEFWGAGVNAAYPVGGTALTLKAGYRHRESFNNNRMKEDRLHSGVEWNVTEKTAIGATYYRTTGSIRTDEVGVGITHSF